MAAQGGAPAKAKGNTRTGCGCLAFLVIAIIIIVAVASSGSGKSGSPEKEARSYISSKGHTINIGRVDYEHVALLIGLLSKSGTESETVINEIAKVAQEAHNEIDGLRSELFDSEASEKLKDATLELSAGANELKNAMGAIVAYTGNPNPATLAHATTQMQSAKSNWNTGVDDMGTCS
jgi:hypothetical protein